MRSDGSYCPDRCDIVWLNVDPQAGREQAGRFAAYVLSPHKYNRVSGLCLVCPIATQIKGYPYEVLLPSGGKARGVVLSDQVKSMSWAARDCDYFDSCPQIAEEVIGKIETLLPAV
jgi:mRNA interferase MazF